MMVASSASGEISRASYRPVSRTAPANEEHNSMIAAAAAIVSGARRPHLCIVLPSPLLAIVSRPEAFTRTRGFKLNDREALLCLRVCRTMAVATDAAAAKVARWLYLGSCFQKQRTYRQGHGPRPMWATAASFKLLFGSVWAAAMEGGVVEDVGPRWLSARSMPLSKNAGVLQRTNWHFRSVQV